jgi:hypothetical protein
VWRFGELIEAPKETSRRIPPAAILGELEFEGDGRLLEEYVGVPGRDVLEGEGDSPAAASVSKNSTHRRENDYRGLACAMCVCIGAVIGSHSPLFRPFSQAPKSWISVWATG